MKNDRSFKCPKFTAADERRYTKFNTVEGVGFYLTPNNKVFLVLPTKAVVFPSLQGSTIKFDDFYEAPKAVHEVLMRVLKRQRELRFHQNFEAKIDAQFVPEALPVNEFVMNEGSLSE